MGNEPSLPKVVAFSLACGPNHDDLVYAETLCQYCAGLGMAFTKEVGAKSIGKPIKSTAVSSA